MASLVGKGSRSLTWRVALVVGWTASCGPATLEEINQRSSFARSEGRSDDAAASLVGTEQPVLKAKVSGSPEYVCKTLNVDPATRPRTYANPIDLPYRFGLADDTYREAADPVIMIFRGKYWLFASKSGGYWHSDNLMDWTFVESTALPIEDYAPTVVAVGDKLYYFAFRSNAIFESTSPETDSWQKVRDTTLYRDPNLYLDDDGRLYLYHGIGLGGFATFTVEELDVNDRLKTIGTPRVVFNGNPSRRGFEVAGDNNTGGLSFIEGAYVSKFFGKYYLQYAGPGTQFRSYADGAAVSTSPLGPFTYQLNSPFSHKPTGFATGAGHGSTFVDKQGNAWHVSTVTISVRNSYERRLALFPAGVSDDDALISNSNLSDFPQYAPGVCAQPMLGNGTGWMLLSKGKKVTVSSTLSGKSATLAVDEDIRTWWSASTGKAGEWLSVDLGSVAKVEALQMNFADEGAVAKGRIYETYRYYVEASVDGKVWSTVVDRKANTRDSPHEYVQLPSTIMARYVRVTNVGTPAGAKFSLGDLRVFGKAAMALPAAPANVKIVRNPMDKRRAVVSWSPVAGAEGYIIRMGTSAKRLTGNYQVYGATSYEIRSLNMDADYSFRVDAFNAAGVTLGK